MNKNWILIGISFACFGVMIGAFGAHGLKSILERNHRFETFETGVKYQMYHAFALIILGILAKNLDSNWIYAAGLCFSIGIIIFSGTLYGLSVTNYTKLGMITPIGGLLFILGWVFCFISVLNK